LRIIVNALQPFLRKRFRQVKHVWGEGSIWTPGDIRHWLQHPLVQARINSIITDGFRGDRFQYFLDRYLNGRLPVQRALTLGSGEGQLERGLSNYNFAEVHEGVDLSEVAVQKAQHAAASGGLAHVRYRVADLNTLRLERRNYDVIFGISSVHHVEKLEHLFGQVRESLKPGGLFLLDEYVGPTKFQWSDEQLRIVNDQLKALPAELKRSVTQEGKTKPRVTRKSVEYVEQSDPSEAVRSAEIIPLLKRYFQILELKGYGGSLLHELLYDIAGNFSEKNSGSLEHLKRLFAIEDELIAAGRLHHDFAVVIATKSDRDRP
jgi:SAM-dependent methyltransferase